MRAGDERFAGVYAGGRQAAKHSREPGPLIPFEPATAIRSEARNQLNCPMNKRSSYHALWLIVGGGFMYFCAAPLVDRQGELALAAASGGRSGLCALRADLHLGWGDKSFVARRQAKA